jgi:hypothetical protein
MRFQKLGTLAERSRQAAGHTRHTTKWWRGTSLTRRLSPPTLDHEMNDRKQNLKRVIREGISTVAQLLGALLLVCGLLPVINPGLVNCHSASITRQLIFMAFLVCPGLVLIIGGRLVQKRLNQDCPPLESGEKKKLKWIILGIVILILIIEFIW